VGHLHDVGVEAFSPTQCLLHLEGSLRVLVSKWRLLGVEFWAVDLDLLPICLVHNHRLHARHHLRHGIDNGIGHTGLVVMACSVQSLQALRVKIVGHASGDLGLVFIS